MADLDVGDQISVGVTHQFDINDDKCWVRLDVSGKVRSGETVSEAYDRVNEALQSQVIKIVESTAKTIIDYEKSQK